MQDEIQGYIAECLEISLEESQTVLEAIESQHGLLVERSQRIYSFSHLTFQEYFTAKWFCQKSDVIELLKYITLPHWREVFLLAATLVLSANNLLLAIKQEVDNMIEKNEEIQFFFKSLNDKAISVDAPYCTGAIRAFYIDIFVSLEYQPDIKYYPLSARTDLFNSFIKHLSSISLPQLESSDLKIDFSLLSILINIFDCYPGNTFSLEECAWYISDIYQFNPSKELKEDMKNLCFLAIVNYANIESLEYAGEWLCSDSETWI